MQAGKFSLETLTEQCKLEYDNPEGKKSVKVRERGYLMLELRKLFTDCGLEVLHLYGGTANNRGHRPLDPDEYEIMIIARRK